MDTSPDAHSAISREAIYTWCDTTTNPFTPGTRTINGLVTTMETTGPFPLALLVMKDTYSWEE